MSIQNEQKINLLLKSQPQGVVFQTSYLVKQGFSNQLLDRYKKSNWLKSIGAGAMIRSGDQVGYEGAAYALQQQSNLSIHTAGKTALALLGKTHYLPFSYKKVILFGKAKEKLPKWFINHDWGVQVDYYKTSFLPSELGLVEFEFKTFNFKISSPARAIMECLYLTPKKQELLECYQIMEGLNNLRPSLVQTLLEECTSIKVKRLFLYLAEKANHDWFNYINPEKVDLGNGKRSFIKNGVYISKYQITVSKALEEYGKL